MKKMKGKEKIGLTCQKFWEFYEVQVQHATGIYSILYNYIMLFLSVKYFLHSLLESVYAYFL